MKQILLLVGVLITAYLGGFAYYYNQIPTKELSPTTIDKYVSHIVLLTGDSERINPALDIVRRRNDVKLLISGVHPDVTRDVLIGDFPERKKRQVDFDYEAQTTLDNALVTKAWLKELEATKIAVITSDYHMPRAMHLFQRHLDRISITPLPIISKDRDWGIIFGEYHKYLWEMIVGF